MEGQCQETAHEVFYIYNNATVLGKVWNGIDAERRQESIDRLRGKVADLRDRSAVRREDTDRFLATLDRAEELNKTKQEGRTIYSARMGVIPDPIILSQLRNFLKDNALEMAIHSIADCECVVPPKKA